MSLLRSLLWSNPLRQSADVRSFLVHKDNPKSDVLVYANLSENFLKLCNEIFDNGIVHHFNNEDKLKYNFNEFVLNLKEITERARSILFLIATDVNGTIPKKYKASFDELLDYYNDHRVLKGELFQKLQVFGIIGFGDKNYGKETFCKPAKQMVKIMSRLSNTTTQLGYLKLIDSPQWDHTIQLNDIISAIQKKFSMAFFFYPYRKQHISTEYNNYKKALSALSRSDNDDSTNTMSMSDDHDGLPNEKENDFNDCDDDIEGFTIDMVSNKQKKVLAKQGYKVVGSHSAVKLCRWTKSHLKKNGGCYKHTFYGIDSSGCMEATPSLACANKCTFCWRHHKNPVGKNWDRWNVDTPDLIVDGILEEHVKMIRNMRTTPGVDPDRFSRNEQLPRHCALSLVGEPIMYPRIQEMCNLLHEKNISTFLVSNAQFPQEMRNLKCVTQLYMSVDANNEGDLTEISRPLFNDSYKRMQECMNICKNEKRHMRTVYRVTLVKDQNMLRLPTDTKKPSPTCHSIPSIDELPIQFHEEASKWADMITKGMPAFVELKGFTYTGGINNSKDEDGLNITNCPYFEEVVALAERVLAVSNSTGIEEYEIASVHQHSNSILIARKDYKTPSGEWLLWIDYPKFFELTNMWDGVGEVPFKGQDYSIPAPEWCLYRSIEQGFDPADKRIKKKGKIKKR